MGNHLPPYIPPKKQWKNCVARLLFEKKCGPSLCARVIFEFESISGMLSRDKNYYNYYKRWGDTHYENNFQISMGNRFVLTSDKSVLPHGPAALANEAVLAHRPEKKKVFFVNHTPMFPIRSIIAQNVRISPSPLSNEPVCAHGPSPLFQFLKNSIFYI